MSLIRQAVERRLGGYRHAVNTTDPTLPLSLDQRVAVVGGGLAGLTAAVTLARRGGRVEVFEANGYLGGKIGAWPVSIDGEFPYVEHGFHAFFRHYHNLNTLLDSLGLRKNFRSIGDYAILGLDGSRHSFAGIDNTPVFNLFSLARRGLWNLGQVLANPRLAGILAMFRYDPKRTFAKYDSLSYQDWSDRLGIPPAMRLMFNSFSRAFFASPDRMSTAELLKSFHSFFLSHDAGLIYDYPERDYETALLRPLRDELIRLGARIHVNAPVESIERSDDFTVRGQAFDAVVLSANAEAARQVVAASPALGSVGFREQMAGLKSSQGYAVWRIWTDRRVETDLPAFVITEHRRVLDSVSLYHRIEDHSRRWSERTGGGVYELHCYALPEGMEEAEVRQAFLEELWDYFPSLRGFRILHEHWQRKFDFTALHTGQYADRPATDTGVPGLYLAGDWVKLPFPAMLMEAAASSGLLAANAVLRAAGRREEPVWSVPPRGLLA